MWTVCKVGVLQRGQKASRSRIKTYSLWIPISKATQSHIFSAWHSLSLRKLDLHQCVCERKGQSNDTVLSAWLQASWKDLAGSGSPQVPFQWAVITAKVSSHTPTHTHTHTHTCSGAAGRMSALRPGPDQVSGGRSWCKEILWWDYQSTLDWAGLGSGTHSCRESTLRQYFSSR